MGHISTKKPRVSESAHRISLPVTAPSKAPHIASVCVLGHKVREPEHNGPRLELLQRTIERIADQPGWRPLDAVLFPGGFVILPEYVGNLPHERRVEVIMASEVGKACLDAARRLNASCPGALLVVGIDSVSPGPGDYGDQLCVAFAAHGIAGIGRKVFPVDADSNGAEIAPLVCYAEDFDSPHRIVRLRSGRNALLCNCYDVFGVAERPDHPTCRTRYIRDIFAHGRLHSVEQKV